MSVWTGTRVGLTCLATIQQPIIPALLVPSLPAQDLPVTDPANLCHLVPSGLLRRGPQNHFTNVHRPLPASNTVTGRTHPHHDSYPTPSEKRTFHLFIGPAVSYFNTCILINLTGHHHSGRFPKCGVDCRGRSDGKGPRFPFGGYSGNLRLRLASLASEEFRTRNCSGTFMPIPLAEYNQRVAGWWKVWSFRGTCAC